MSTVFMDRDGVVNVRRYCPEDPTKHYVLKWEDFEWMPGAKEACARLLDEGHNLFFVSNQAGINKGLASKQDVSYIFSMMLGEIQAIRQRPKNHALLDYRYCPHWRDGVCECRKPSPGLLYSLMVCYGIYHAECWMIGDAWSDMKAGWNAGIRKLIKLPSLEDPEAPEYDYELTRRMFNLRTADGVLIDNLPHAVDFILKWESKPK